MEGPAWRLLIYRLPTEPSRHRVAVWRELRRAGAVALQQATWAVPAGEDFDAAVSRALDLIARAEGHSFLFDVGPSVATEAQLEALFTAEREAEWVEFLSECDKVEAELDEEEQSHERLRHWYRELRARDLYGAPSAEAAEARLKECAEALETFAEHVFRARER